MYTYLCRQPSGGRNGEGHRLQRYSPFFLRSETGGQCVENTEIIRSHPYYVGADSRRQIDTTDKLKTECEWRVYREERCFFLYGNEQRYCGSRGDGQGVMAAVVSAHDGAIMMMKRIQMRMSESALRWWHDDVIQRRISWKWMENSWFAVEYQRESESGWAVIMWDQECGVDTWA